MSCPSAPAGQVPRADNLMKLDVGGGPPREGWTTIDLNPRASIVHDLNKYPWPIPDNSYDFLRMSHVLEHLRDRKRVMQEAYRIARHDAVLEVRVPWHKKEDFSNPAHLWRIPPGFFRRLNPLDDAWERMEGQCRMDWFVVRDRKVRDLFIWNRPWVALTFSEYRVWLRANKGPPFDRRKAKALDGGLLPNLIYNILFLLAIPFILIFGSRLDLEGEG